MSTNSALMRFVAAGIAPSLVAEAQRLHQLPPVCPGGLVPEIVLDQALDRVGHQAATLVPRWAARTLALRISSLGRRRVKFWVSMRASVARKSCACEPGGHALPECVQAHAIAGYLEISPNALFPPPPGPRDHRPARPTQQDRCKESLKFLSFRRGTSKANHS